MPTQVPVKSVPDEGGGAGAAGEGAVGESPPPPHESVTASTADHTAATNKRVTIVMILQSRYVSVAGESVSRKPSLTMAEHADRPQPATARNTAHSGNNGAFA